MGHQQTWQTQVDPEVPPDARTLVKMAQDVMNRVLYCFTAQNVIPPERQVIYMSPIPADCAQVAVLFSGWTPLPPWDMSTDCLGCIRWFANLSVIITRCTPAVPKSAKSMPTPEQMLAAAEIASADAEVLLAICNAVTEVGSDLTVLTPAPQGGFQTVELTFQIPAVGALE